LNARAIPSRLLRRARAAPFVAARVVARDVPRVFGARARVDRRGHRATPQTPARGAVSRDRR
jgi:hypothetical protein